MVWVFENAVNVLIVCAGLDFVIALERQSAFFHGEDARFFRVKSLYAVGLPAAALTLN